MKTRQLLTKALYSAAFGAAMLFATSNVQAQVKIGNNPTVIGSSNHLEVESTLPAGMKTSIDKAGKVTIKDGTEGAGRVFTSDAAGQGSWQLVTPTTPVWVSVYGHGLIGGAGSGITKFYFDGASFDRGGNFNLTTHTFTVPSAGIYSFNVFDQVGNGFTDNYTAYGRLNRIGVGLIESGYFNLGVSAGQSGTGTASTMTYLNAGDQVIYEVSGDGTARNRDIHLQIIKLSN
jgi:hypothetical protein